MLEWQYKYVNLFSLSDEFRRFYVFPSPLLCVFSLPSLWYLCFWGALLNHTGIGATGTRALSPLTTENLERKEKEKQPYNNLLTMDWLPPRGSGQRFNMRSWKWPAVDQLPLKGLEGNPWQYNPQEVKRKKWKIEFNETRVRKCVRADVARKAVVAQLVKMLLARYSEVRMPY